MKSSKLFLSAIILAFVFVSCDNKSDSVIEYQIPDSVSVSTIVDFENVALNEDSIWNGSDLLGNAVVEDVWGQAVTNHYGSIETNGAKFENVYTVEWSSWSGFAVSSKTDVSTAGNSNQYSVSAGIGAQNSKQFALCYGKSTLVCDSNVYGHFSIQSIMLTNSTYTYFDMLNGSAFSKKFAAEDWYKVIVKGFLNNSETGTIEYYLADFRNGKTFLSNTWNKVDVSSLGEVDKVTFEFDSSDKGQFGINTPQYMCIDNIEFSQTFSTK